MRRAYLHIAVGITVALASRPSDAHAQLDAFTQAVRQLADAATQTEPSRISGIRAAANRMGAALVEWDRHIKALEARADRERASAPAPDAYPLRVELGVAYRARGRVADALREFDAAAALRPAASDLQVLRALTLEAMGRSEAARDAFKAAWDRDTGNPIKAYYVIQRSATASEADRDRARAVLAATYRRLAREANPAAAPFLMLDVIPDNLSNAPIVADAATTKGFALLRAGQYSDAVDALTARNQAPTSSDDAPVAHLHRARIAEAQGQVAAARREYQAALPGVLTGGSTMYVAIGRLAQVDGDSAGAIDAFTRAVQLNPNDAVIHKELASVYAAEGRVDDAFCELVAAVLIDSRDARAHAAVGQLYLDAGRDADAVSAFTRALELMPDAYETRYALATAHTRLGNTGEATRQLDIFERARRDLHDQRRRGIANEVEREEAIRRGLAGQPEPR